MDAQFSYTVCPTTDRLTNRQAGWGEVGGHGEVTLPKMKGGHCETNSGIKPGKWNLLSNVGMGNKESGEKKSHIST